MDKVHENSPIRVLLVEDEVIILNGLKQLVDWEALGFTLCGAAADYDEALSQAYLTKPDLVITDIMLGEGRPTGLDLVKKLHPLMPRTKVVLLTGYDRFEYAKEAIRYTVKAYLLKPLSAAALTECLTGLRGQFYAERVEETERAALRRHVAAAQPFLFDWLFLPAAGKAEDSLLALPGDCTGYTVIVVSFREQQGGDALYPLFLEMQALTALQSDEVLSFYRHGQFVVLLCHRSAPQGRPHELAAHLQQFLDFRGIVHYAIGVGSTAGSAEEIRESYRQAGRACDYQQFLGAGKVLSFADISVYPPQQRMSLRDTWDELSVLVRVGDADKTGQLLEDFFAEAAGRGAGIARLRGLGYEAMVLLDELAAESGLAPEGYGEAISGSESLAALLDYVQAQYRRVAQAYGEKRASRNHAALEQALAFIGAHYAENLSLEALAAEVYLSPSYLSYLFSAELGKTFKSHLTDVRMERAQQLLADPARKVYEVAEQVGYTDTRYFGQVFKKATGMTPLEYRKQFSA